MENIYQAIIKPDEVVIIYFANRMMKAVSLPRWECEDHTYAENFGLIIDSISRDIGHPLEREEVFYLAKYCRETILDWSK